MTRPITVSVAAALVAIASSTSYAETCTPEGDEAAIRAERLFDSQKYEDAIAQWEIAYQECGDPTFLYNLAQASRKLERFEAAKEFYKRYLTLAKDVTPDERAAVETKIAELDKLLRDKKANTDGPPEGIRSDPASPPPDAGAIPGPATPARVESTDEPPRSGEAWWRDPWGWTAVGAGAVLLGVGLWFFVDAADLDDQADRSSVDDERLRLREEAADSRTTGTVLSIAGGAALVGGVVLLAITPSAPKTSARARVTVGPGWLVLQGRF